MAMVEQARARHPGGLAKAILDCGDDGTMAQMALALGWRCLVLRGRVAVRAAASPWCRRIHATWLGSIATMRSAETSAVTNWELRWSGSARPRPAMALRVRLLIGSPSITRVPAPTAR